MEYGLTLMAKPRKEVQTSSQIEFGVIGIGNSGGAGHPEPGPDGPVGPQGPGRHSGHWTPSPGEGHGLQRVMVLPVHRAWDWPPLPSLKGIETVNPEVTPL